MDKEQLFKVIKLINNSLEETQRLDDERLGRTFQKFWPDFKTKCLDRIPEVSEEPRVQRLDRDLLEEALILLRQLPKQLSVPSGDVIQDFRMRVEEFHFGTFDLNRGVALGGQIYEYFLQFGNDTANITNYDRLSGLGGRLMRAVSCDEATAAIAELHYAFDDMLGVLGRYGSGSGSY